jgi:hypothetical protein
MAGLRAQVWLEEMILWISLSESKIGAVKQGRGAPRSMYYLPIIVTKYVR